MRISTVLSSLSSLYRTTYSHPTPAIEGETRAFFVDDPTIDSIEYSDIQTDHTGWVMHGSEQNNCSHLKIGGKCYRFESAETVRPASYTFPTFRFRYGSTVIQANVPFAMKTGMTHVLTVSDGNLSRSIYMGTVFEPCRLSRYKNMYYIYASGFVVHENLKTGYKYFTAFGRDYTYYVTLGPIYYDGKKCSNNFVGRGRHSIRVYFDMNNQPALKFGADAGYYDQNAPRLVDCGWHDITPVTPTIQEILRFDPYDRFKISFSWSETLAQGLNQVNFFDSNGIAFAKDAAALPSTLRSDLESLKQFAKASKSGKLRIAASIFLSVHYGYKLMIADAEDLLTELLQYERKNIRHIGQTASPTIGLHSVGDFELKEASGHLNVYYHPFSKLITEIGAFLEAFDLIPDFSNVWDMIPFSFVVDWFTNIGDLASGIDDFFTLTQESEVEGSIRSQKISYLYHPQDFIGTITISNYTRSCGKGWYPIPKFSFQLKNPVTDLYHWMESTALVVSKIP